MSRLRACVHALGAAAVAPLGFTAPAASDYAQVRPGVELVFPHDEGSHPDFRVEWWYATGWLYTKTGEALGFQVTFFRTRMAGAEGNPSAFAPRQILIAHAALSDPRRGRLFHAQRIARAGFGLASAAIGRTEVHIDEWRLAGGGRSLTTRIVAPDFGFDLALERTQAPLPQGESGYSRKGPDPLAASHYYSLPGLKVSGRIERDGVATAVHGEAWLDHEWSSAYLAPEAEGWDWVGLNGSDGSALMAFRIRRLDGASFWAAATHRDASGRVRTFGPEEVHWEPQRRWRSPRTDTPYPVEWILRIGERRLRLDPLMDDQESDSRATTGAVYWEGAIRAFEGPREIARGYLELTGYGRKLELPGG